MTTTRIRFAVDKTIGEVSALLQRPADARLAYVLAHGAGAGMEHAFMEAIAERLARRGIACFRFQFPYTEAGKKRPDHRKTLEATVRAAVAEAHRQWPDLPLIAGGKSMGGRISSQCQAQAPLPGVVGIAFLGFPLHAPNKPADKRAEHLQDVDCPMLFLQGTRDALASLDLLTPIVDGLPSAVLHIVEGGDHSFKVLKRSGRTHDEVLDELCDTLATWTQSLQ